MAGEGDRSDETSGSAPAPASLGSHLRRLERLLEAVGELATAPDETALCEHLLDRALDLLAATEGRVLRIGANAGAQAALARTPLSPPSPGSPTSTSGTAVSASAPLRLQESVYGSVEVARRNGPAFDREDMRALEVLSHHAAIALEHLREREAATQRAEHDALTGLANRDRLWRQLESEIARAARHDRTLALVLFDVDGFKAYNDRHGHLAGDEALSRIGGLLARGGRASDLAARAGGDEFALLLPETDLAGARARAEKLRASVQNEFGVGDHSLRVCAGVAAFPADGANARALYEAADQRLYRAKAGGGNRCA